MRPASLADICRTNGLTLADLARVSGVSLSSVKQLEQNPPRRKSTWYTWKRRVSSWIPLLGHAFPYVLENRAFKSCPHEVLEDLLQQYYTWADNPDEQPETFSRDAVRELEFLTNVAILDERGDWDGAEVWIGRAERLFPWHDSRWAYHRFTRAQLKVNKGELDAAEQLINNTLARHQHALKRRGLEWEPSSLALAEATRAWSYFLRGEWDHSRIGFNRAIDLAHDGHDIEIVHRGLHMSARALTEPYIVRAYYSMGEQPQRLDRNVSERSMQGIEAALVLDQPDSPRHAFGLWYKGILFSLSGDIESGRYLIERAESQMRTSGMIVAAASHARLSRIHLDILCTGWDSTTFRRYEMELLDMLPLLQSEKFPYAFSDVLITVVYCHLQQRRMLRSLKDRQEMADLLGLALVAHPHPKHELFKVGKYLLTEIVMPQFSDRERADYIDTLCARVYSGESHFAYLLDWRFDLSPLDDLIRVIRSMNK